MSAQLPSELRLRTAVPAPRYPLTGQGAAFLFSTQSTEASQGLTPDVLDLDKLTQCVVLPHR